MKQAVITYTDRDQVIMAIKGPVYLACLWDLNEDLRQKLKHNNHNLKTPEAVMEYVREYITNSVDLQEIE